MEDFAPFGMLQRQPFSACCNHSRHCHPLSTLVDRPPSLLPFPIDGHGQPLFSPESTSSHTDQVPIDEDSEEAIFAVQNMGSPAVKGIGILHTPVSPRARLAHSSSFSPFRRSDPPPSFTSSRFDDDILPTPHFSTRLPSPSSLLRSGSSLLRSGPPQQASLPPFLVRHPRPLGRIPFPFLPSPLPKFLHLLLIRPLSSRLFLFHLPPSHPCLCFLRHSTLIFFTFVKSHNVLYHALS